MIGKRCVTWIVLAAVAPCCLAARTADAEQLFFVELEGGAVFSGYNDVRIPGSTGTLFSLVDDLDTETGFAFRGRFTFEIGERHILSLLAAPLTLDASGSIDESVDFEGETFEAGTPLDARYRFNSYRITYRYGLYASERFSTGIGITGKVRDAAIEISGGGKTREKKNVGFVPLVNFSLVLHVHPRLGLLLEGDALAAPQGRAEDVLLAVLFDLDPDFGIRAGYRILEGGADNDEVYNFALLHFAVLGIEARF
jgi:hypothetical protein